jgi:hypothetical protein
MTISERVKLATLEELFEAREKAIDKRKFTKL